MTARISPTFRAFRAVVTAIVLLFAAMLVAACLDVVARASAAAPDAAIDPSMGLAVPAAPALQQASNPPAAAAGMDQEPSPGRSDGPAAQAAPVASELHNPALDPAAAWDDARAVRRLGWPAAVFALVTMLALALGTAGARVPWLAWLARGTAATLLGAVAACGSAAYDATIAGGTPATIGTALVLTAFAFWQAHRAGAGGDDAARAAYERYLHSSGGKSLVSDADLPGYDALPDAIKAAWRAAANPGAPRISRRPERGFASGPLIAILGCAAITVGAMGAWSCSGARRTTTAVKEAVVDCAKLTAETRVAEYADRVGAAILAGTAPNGELSFAPARREIASILADVGLEVAGCAAATAVARLLYPTADAPRGIAATPEPSPARVRDGWDEARASMLGGRRFSVQIGAL